MQPIIPSLWFADNNCEEAINYYLTVFPNSRIVEKHYYPEASLDPHFEGMEGKIITAVFELNGVRFVALDGGPLFRFNESVSFTILCKDQAEIDHYWSKLSHVPEAEACGWCKDKFGLSWQIVPADVNRYMQNSAATQAMMTMKKIDISELENAK